MTTRGQRIADPRLWLHDLSTLVRFFSRLPVPADTTRADVLPRAVALMPLAALVISTPAVLVGALLAASQLPALAVALLIVAAQGLTTGFLHEDGLSDAADGLIGGRDRDHRLAIMRDSRIGAFGAMALVLAVMLRASLMAAALGKGAGFAVGAILAAGIVSRTLMILVWRSVPPARSDGLAAGIGRPDAAPVGIAVAMTVLLLAAGLTLLPAGGTALGCLGAAAAAAAVAAYARHRIGGQTGDVLGAAQQAGEAGFLVGLLAV